VLAGRADLETWTPESAELAQAAIGDVAAYCRDYCPARLACGEEACRLYRLETRASEVIHGGLEPGDASEVGVLDQQVIAL